MAGMLDEAYSKDFKTKKREANGAKVGSSSSPITKNGYQKAHVVSALQKMIRRGMEPEALYWASELLESGESYTFWRRIFAITAEDVGLADPDMPPRIAALNDMARLCQEWNIPFMAVMLLCRAPKNREADDAAWMYEERRKAGWKIPIPAVAVDGHTREGKSRLYQIARADGSTMEETWNKEFFYDAALLKGYQPIVDPHDPEQETDRYRRAMMAMYKMPFETYELNDCSQPRILTGREVYDSVLAQRAPEKVEYRPKANHSTGEVVEGVFEVRSFTSEEVYVVDLVNESCTCPAYLNTSRACKHVIAVDRLENAQ